MPKKSRWLRFADGRSHLIRLGGNVPYTDIDKMNPAVRTWARTQNPRKCVHLYRTGSPILTPEYSAELREKGADAVLIITDREDCTNYQCQQAHREWEEHGQYR